MDEAAARDVVLVQAVELADRDRILWSDADREWATRSAAEVVTEAGTPEAFLARRAEFARGRLTQRFPLLRRVWRASVWPHWLAPSLVIAALVVGLALDHIGDARINILAPPILGLLAWNLFIYVVLAFGAVRRWLGGPATDRWAPLRHALGRMGGATGRTARSRTPLPLVQALAGFGASWPRASASLYWARAARILHLAAAALALGLIVGFYVRGLAFEYRASWQSTFLDPPQVHGLLRVVLAPGRLVTRLPMPTVDRLEQLRTIAPEAGENAAPWLHLYAATVVVIVIGPRLLLAAAAWITERRRARRLPVDVDAPYFRRLLRAFAQGPLPILVVPYSFALTSAAVARLQTIAARAFGACEVVVAPTVPYGGEDSLPPEIAPRAGQAIFAMFNATATPEAETHGAFLRALKARAQGGECLALVDEAAFRTRWPGDERRLGERRQAWEQAFAAVNVAGVFVDLAKPDLGQSPQALQAALEHAGA